MRLFERASLGSRGLAVVFGMLGVVGLCLPAAWSTVTGDDQSSVGSGLYPAAHAITGARIIAAPGKTYDPGTIVVRRGIIESVGPDKEVTVPYDAETIDGKGLVVYPGFLDLYTTIGQAAGVERSATGKGRPVDLAEAPLPSTPPDNRKGLTPEFEVAGALEFNDGLADPRRRLGFTDLLSAPAGAIATGQSALVSLSGLPRRETIVAAPVALHVNLAPPTEPAAAVTPAQPAPTPGPGPGQNRRRGLFTPQAGENPYPRVLMGSVAHFRQAMLDGDHARTLETYYQAHGGPRPAFDPALKALQSARSKRLAIWWEANTRDEIHRALDLAEEFGTSAVIVGGKEAAKVVDRLKAGKVPVVLRLNFPVEPKVPTEEEYQKRPPAERDEPLKLLAHRKAEWKKLVGTAAVLAKAGVPFAFSSDGIERIDSFPGAVRQLITAGLTADQALAGLTRSAAAIALVDKRLGTLEAGKLAHVVAMTAPFTEERAKVRYVLLDGVKFDIKPEDRARTKARAAGPDGAGPDGAPGERPGLAGKGGTGRRSRGEATENDRPNEREGSENAADRKSTREPGETAERRSRPGAETPAKKSGTPRSPDDSDQSRVAIAAAPTKAAAKPTNSENDLASQPQEKTADDAKPGSSRGDDAAKPQERRPKEAQSDDAKPAATGNEPAKPETSKQRPSGAQPQKAETAKSDTSKSESKKPPAPPFHDVATELDEDRKPVLHTGGDVLIKDATILTVTKGTIAKGSILVKGGKIKAVGSSLTAPEGVLVINAAGMVAMPGIIDTHSHIAVQGGVNEGTLSIVPEVRVKDVVTGDDVMIYRALAGGTTTARLLHGSANTIGGQDAVIKLKYGQAGRDLIIRDGPQGVKFALGENVTRSTRRFPNTRMGVESVIERAFEEGRAYRERWDEFRKEVKSKGEAAAGPPPRVDLRLEALAGVLDGSIKVHCHCYRSDEILMLLRAAQRYGVRVQSLQHVLEGYKVAAEIAAHGASSSTFSDWWAYKIEAYDAIPFNAALLTEAGASVCIKSDDAELMRHLNLEAAKMVKYGGVSETQALAMITINAARQLGLDARLGSIEVGKDADIVLYNGHPFDAFSRCELAIIDGEVFFQRYEPGGGFGVRPGEHAVMPAAAESVRNRSIEIAAQPKNLFALVGANLHPVSGPEIKGGTLVIAGGKIAAIGPAGTPIPPEAQTIELSGLDVWPGMVDAGSTIGLFEIGSLAETQDHSDAAQYQPELRTSTAIHADSEHIPVTRANGVLTSLVQPTGGIISGQSCLIDLNGWVPREMVVADRLALDVRIPPYVARSPDSPRPGLGPNRPGPGPGPGGALAGENAAAEARKQRLDKIKELFRMALAYDRVVSKAHERGESPPAPDLRLEALLPYARGEKPVILHANQPVEILDALEIARDLKLKAVISGAADAWKVAEAIKQAKVPVLIEGALNLPRHEHDPYDSAYSNAAKLHAAGVTFAIHSKSGGASGETAARNLPFEAAAAIAFGLPEDVGLKAVTLTPAQILGVADQVGSLESGKRANVVITAGHLLQPTTPVLALFIDGEPLRPESRHTQLYAKYRRRLDEVRAGRAKLGIDEAPTKLSGTSPASPPPTRAERQ
jgi:imidazolonepropionase-like amidohydrolase